MLLRGSFTGPLNVLTLCNHTIKWLTDARLLGVTVDNKLTWSQHIFEVKKSFVNKLNLLKRSSFLPRNILLDLYFNPRTYKQINIPPSYKGRRWMEPLPRVFDMLQYFETILPLVESLWSSEQDEVCFMGGSAAGGLWRHQQRTPSWSPRIGNQVKTSRNGNVLCFTWKITHK